MAIIWILIPNAHPVPPTATLVSTVIHVKRATIMFHGAVTLFNFQIIKLINAKIAQFIA